MLFAIGNKLPIAIFLIVSGVLPSASEGLIGIVVSTVFIYIYIAGVAVVNQTYIPSTASWQATPRDFPFSLLDLTFINFNNDCVLTCTHVM